MLASSSLMLRLITRRPKPCRSAKPGWAPIETPFCWQSLTVSTITTGSLAWKPQATLADFTIFSTSPSLPMTQGPKLSPRSELMLTNPALVAAMADSFAILSFRAILADVSVRYLSCGDTAFTVEFGNEISSEINGRVMALHAAIGRAAREGALEGVVETVPTFRSLMVSYDPLKTTRARLEPEIADLIAPGPPVETASRRVTIPCCYDDRKFAPDLAEVAERTKKTPEQVIGGHLASPFKVYFVGFMPGL